MDLRSSFSKKTTVNMMSSELHKESTVGGSRRPAAAQRAAQQDICAVCLNSDGGIDTVLLPCHHAFHGDCIIRWVEANFSCPLCRRTIEQFLPIEKGEHVLHLDLDEHDLENASKSAIAQRIKSQEIFLKFIEIWEKHYLQIDASNLSTSKQSFSTSQNKQTSSDSKVRLYTISEPNIRQPHRQLRRSASLRHSSSYPSFAKLREEESTILDNINIECRTPALYMDWNPPSLSEFQNLNNTADIHINTNSQDSADSSFSPERDLTFQRTDSSFSALSLTSQIPTKIEIPSENSAKLRRNSVGGFGPGPEGSPHIDCACESQFLGCVPVIAKKSDPLMTLQSRTKRKNIATFLNRERFLARSRRPEPSTDVHFCGKIKPCKMDTPPPTPVRQVLESSLPPKLQTANHLKAGCVAGVATALLVHAFDGNARRFTSSIGYQKGLGGGLAVFRGLPGFFSGFAPTLFTVIPTCMVYFSVYEHMKNNSFFIHNSENHPVTQVGAHMVSAGIAATLGHMVHKPSSLIPIRYGIQFGAFELGKSLWMRAGRSKGNERHLGPLSIMTTAALGGLVASSVIYPTQRVLAGMKMPLISNLQLGSLSLGSSLGNVRAGSQLFTQSGISQVVSAMSSNNVQTLYKGWSSSLARFLPACVVTATAYEFALRGIAKE